MLCSLHAGCLPASLLAARALQRIGTLQPSASRALALAAGSTLPAADVQHDLSDSPAPLTRIQRSQQGLDFRDRKTPKSVKRKVAMYIGYVGTGFSGAQQTTCQEPLLGTGRNPQQFSPFRSPSTARPARQHHSGVSAAGCSHQSRAHQPIQQRQPDKSWMVKEQSNRQGRPFHLYSKCIIAQHLYQASWLATFHSEVELTCLLAIYSQSIFYINMILFPLMFCRSYPSKWSSLLRLQPPLGMRGSR